MDAASAIDPSRCPLCGQPNGCAMHATRSSGDPPQPCWCVAQTFSAELLARVPAAAQRVACICARCAGTGGST